MDDILRAAGIYAFTLLIFRLSGKRSVAQLTTFDLVVVVIIGNATQQAALGNDFSLTTAFLTILTLIAIDTGLSLLKQRWQGVGKIIDGVPTVIVEDGRLLRDRMNKLRVDEGDILSVAHQTQGLERLDQIKYAVLERSGSISIIPKQRQS